MKDDLAKAITTEYHRRIFFESIPRIKSVLDLLDENEVWETENQYMNSIGNLILHLCGNVRQWICAGAGGQVDIRQRQKEFDTAPNSYTKDALINMLYALKKDTMDVLLKLNDSDLLAAKEVQGFEETNLSIIIHVVEHFSYHTGQIALMAKQRKRVDLGFYKDIDLDKKN